MEIEKQVCSLEYAKKLLTLEVKQNSLFYWVRDISDWNITAVITDKDKMYFNHSILDIFPMEYCSAFTASELLNILPKYIDTKDDVPFNNFIFNMQMSLIVLDDNKAHKCYSINYHCDTVQFEIDIPHFALKLFKKNIYDKSLANAAAKTLIYLIENGYVKNERTKN